MRGRTMDYWSIEKKNGNLHDADSDLRWRTPVSDRDVKQFADEFEALARASRPPADRLECNA